MKFSLRLFFVLCFPSFLLAQDFYTQYRSLTVTDGLPHISVNQILQDHRGFIWIATFNGIARFDGVRIKTYYPSYQLDSLAPSRDYPVMHESVDGQLWIGYMLAKNKLFRYDLQRDTFLHFELQALQADSSIGIRSIWQDEDQKLWLATGDRGLWVFDIAAKQDTIPYTVFQHDKDDPQSIPTNYMASKMWRDAEKRLWVLTENGLACLEQGKTFFTNYTWSDIPIENEGLNFWPDQQRRCFWIGTFVGLVRFNWDDKSHQRYQVFADNNNEETLLIGSPIVDSNGTVWVSAGGYPNSQLYIFEPEKGRFRRIASEQAGSRVFLPGANDLLPDRNGGIWSGGFNRALQRIQTHKNNVSRILLSKENKHTPSVSFDEGGVRTMSEDKQGNIWLGTVAQGLWKWMPQQQQLERINLSLQDESINHLLLSKDKQQLWILTQNAVFKLNIDTQSWQEVTPFSEKPHYAVYRAAIELNDKIVGSCFQYGMFQIDVSNVNDQQTYLINQPESIAKWKNLAVNSINCMAVGARPQQIWLGTSFMGIFGWNYQKKELTSHLENLGIHHIVCTADNLLWVSTTKGLIVYDPQKRETTPILNKRDNRLNFIMSMILDEEGLIWIADEQGIIAIDVNTKQVIHDFEASEWLTDKQKWYSFLSTALPTKSGDLLFANANGIYAVRPSAVRYDSLAPQVCLDEWWVGNDKHQLPAHPLEEIRLPHDKNDLSFRLAVQHYKLPAKNQLFYKLEPFDKVWRNTTVGPLIEYPNLGPGNYTLLAYGVNSDGYKSKQQRIMEIRIAPPWYASTLAYCAYGIGFLALVYGVFRLQLWRKTQEAEQHYWKELDRAKSTLFTNISHEFRTPLTLILGEASSLQEKLSGQIRAQSQRIKRSGQRLLWLVNQLLELARADSGFLKLELQQADIVAFLRQHMQAFHSLAELRGIALVFRSEITELYMDFDPERLQRVFSNLLHNAIKFSDDEGQVTMSLRVLQTKEKSVLSCFVKDEGVGIPEEELTQVFDRFYRVNDNQSGSGIGLALTKELVMLMGGDIKATSKPGKGSTFEVCLPITSQAPPGDGNWNSAQEIASFEDNILASEQKTAQLSLPHLLVIEDNEDLRSFLQVCLAANYQLSLARDGQEGLDLAFDQTFDLIISDVMMPRLDGFIVCQTLKEELSTSHIPIILLTARVDKASRLEGLARGADAYLAKPFDPNELRLLCRQLLRQRQRLSRYFLEMIRTGQLSEDLLSEEEQLEMAFIVDARQQVITNLGNENFGVEELAQGLNISRSHLHRKLHQMVGMSSSRFIRSIRISQAQKHLVDPSLSIREVAFKVGFGDSDYFSRIFKDECGVSPSIFRNRTLNGNK